MNGYPVGLFAAVSMSPAQNRMAMRAAKPRTPLRMVVATIVLGTTVEASWISSAVYKQSAYSHEYDTLRYSSH